MRCHKGNNTCARSALSIDTQHINTAMYSYQLRHSGAMIEFSRVALPFFYWVCSGSTFSYLAYIYIAFTHYFITHHRHIPPCPRSWSSSVLPTPAASTYLFVRYQTIGMIGDAVTRILQARGWLDDEESWEDTDDAHVLDDEETQEESLAQTYSY